MWRRRRRRRSSELFCFCTSLKEDASSSAYQSLNCLCFFHPWLVEKEEEFLVFSFLFNPASFFSLFPLGRKPQSWWSRLALWPKCQHQHPQAHDRVHGLSTCMSQTLSVRCPLPSTAMNSKRKEMLLVQQLLLPLVCRREREREQENGSWWEWSHVCFLRANLFATGYARILANATAFGVAFTNKDLFVTLYFIRYLLLYLTHLWHRVIQLQQPCAHLFLLGECLSPFAPNLEPTNSGD